MIEYYCRNVDRDCHWAVRTRSSNQATYLYSFPTPGPTNTNTEDPDGTVVDNEIKTGLGKKNISKQLLALNHTYKLHTTFRASAEGLASRWKEG